MKTKRSKFIMYGAGLASEFRVTKKESDTVTAFNTFKNLRQV